MSSVGASESDAGASPSEPGSGRASASETQTVVTAAVGRPRSVAGSSDDDESRSQLGRYLIIEVVGRGGMGVVYRAYDPRLQREVALKCVRAEALSREAQRRMIVEAQSMAKLSHPNVVAVYDVEIAHDQVVLAMELVDGQTLRDWIKQGPHGWREVVRLFIAAGRGLAAAHDGGIVHRDFKPANVLIGEDGRPHVTDFGLARVQIEVDPSQASQEGPNQSNGESRDLTEAGLVMGTPAYMAPEQHTAEPLGPAADQFAFCVSLWYALCGERPFDGDTLEEIAQAKHAGPPAFPRVTPSVPTPIVDAVRRGLAPKPDDRWPTMAQLLEALDFDPTAVRRRWMWRGALGSIVVLGALAFSGWNKSATGACTDLARQRIDEVWGDDASARVSDALLSVGTDYAGGVALRVDAALDGYAQAWTAARIEACEASNVRGEQSAAALDLRMACLDRAKMELEATVEVLAQADRTSLGRADEVVASLPPLSRCADVEALTAATPPPDDPAVAEQVDGLRRQLAEARALQQAGQYTAADALAGSLMTAAQTVDYPPLLTDIELVHAQAARASADYPRAEALLRSALRRALQWGQWSEALDASQRLTHLLSATLARYEEGEVVLDVARGFDQRLEFGPRQRAETLGLLAAIATARGDPATARDRLVEVLALQREVLAEDDLEVLVTRSRLASVHGDLGEYEQAEQEYREVLAARRARLGDTHPAVATTLDGLAECLQQQGRHDEADPRLAEALKLRVAALGPDHPSVADTRIHMGHSLIARGDLKGAEREYRAALTIYEQAFGADHSQAALAHASLGSVLYQQERFAEAEQAYRAALRAQLAVLPATHPDVAGSKHNIGLMLNVQDRQREAIEMYREAAPVFIQTLGPDHPTLGFVHSNLALAHHGLGEYRDAEREILRSLDIRTEKLGLEHSLTLDTLTNYGLILQGKGDREGALAQFSKVVAGRTAALGREHPDTGTAHANEGDALLALGRYDEARRAYRRAMEILEPSLGETAVRTSQAYEGLGNVALAQGHRAEAARWFEKNWAAMEPQDTHGIYRARAAFELAQVLWPEQRTRARQLAREAVDGFEALHSEELAEAKRWLDAHAGG